MRIYLHFLFVISPFYQCVLCAHLLDFRPLVCGPPSIKSVSVRSGSRRVDCDSIVCRAAASRRRRAHARTRMNGREVYAFAY